MALLLWAALLFGLSRGAAAWDNGLALTPPKGFATWNIWPFTNGVNRSCSPPTCSPQRWIMEGINESQCKHWAQALVDTGLVKDGGFEYFVVQVPRPAPLQATPPQPRAGARTHLISGGIADSWSRPPPQIGAVLRASRQRDRRHHRRRRVCTALAKRDEGIRQLAAHARDEARDLH